MSIKFRVKSAKAAGTRQKGDNTKAESGSRRIGKGKGQAEGRRHRGRNQKAEGHKPVIRVMG